MPGSRRRQQCAFKEGRVRCRRDGTGNPPLCAPHLIIVQEQARQAAGPRSPLEGLFGLVDDFISGRPINREKIASTINETIRGYTDVEAEVIWDGQGRTVRERVHVRPPPIVDELAQRRAAIAKAKVALGFAASEPVTLEQLKKRQRELARKYHPDRGGSLEKMQAINEAVDILENTK